LLAGSGNLMVLASLASVLVLVELIIIQPIGTAAVLRVISQEYIGRRVSLGEALSFAMSRFAKLLGTSILAGLLIFLWALAFVIPGIIAAFSYSLVGQVVSLRGSVGWLLAIGALSWQKVGAGAFSGWRY